MLGKIVLGGVAFGIGSAAMAQDNAAAGAPLAKVPVYFDFKGSRLGMSLSEWKALPLPVRSEREGSQRYSPVQIVCSGDPVASQRPGMVFERSRAEQAANVLECAYARQHLGWGLGAWRRVPIHIGITYAASEIAYKFLDERLYQVTIISGTYLLADVDDGLTAKWGEPSTVLHDTMQNKAGATFPHLVKTWANSVATIQLEAPYSRIDDLKVTYETVEGSAKIRSVEKAINPDAEKM